MLQPLSAKPSSFSTNLSCVKDKTVIWHPNSLKTVIFLITKQSWNGIKKQTNVTRMHCFIMLGISLVFLHDSNYPKDLLRISGFGYFEWYKEVPLLSEFKPNFHEASTRLILVLWKPCLGKLLMEQQVCVCVQGHTMAEQGWWFPISAVSSGDFADRSLKCRRTTQHMQNVKCIYCIFCITMHFLIASPVTFDENE